MSNYDLINFICEKYELNYNLELEEYKKQLRRKKMNIEQIKKDWEQHCKEYGFKSDIDHNSNGCLYLTTKEHSQGVIKIFRRINELVFTNLKNGYSEEQYKLFTTFYTKLMEQDNE